MRPRLTWDRFTDFHLLVALSAALALAGVGVLAMPLGGWSDAPPILRPIGWALLMGAVGLACWAIADRRAERRRRAKLDREVDSELSGKWDGGFASAVGAYEKPWYLLCGETGVGKTAALRAADLPKAVGPDGRPLSDPKQGINGTFMFDWWFLRDAVVLDSAGDLLQNPDRRWVSFLERVRAGRPLQPINGMIIAIAATDFLSGDADALRRKARLLARQVEVAREQLRVRFPLYVLITKTDLVPGFAEYFPRGSGAKFSDQILGWSNPQDPRSDDGSARTADEVRQGLRQFVDELRDQRGVLLEARPAADSNAKRIDCLDGMFAFPRALAGFLGALEQLVDELLGSEAAAVAPPFLRGIYFTSALQNEPVARPASKAKAFDADDALDTGSPAAASQRGAFFLRDLLVEKIIPEAGIVTPLQDVVSGVRRRGRALVTAALVGSLLVGGTAVLGYVQTAGRTRPHAEFWGQLVQKAQAGTLGELALFDNGGRYRGANVDPAMRASVLDVHETAADLAGERTSTWLLPLSTRADRERRLAHRELFREMVLRPLLTPPPAAGDLPPSGSLPPAGLVKAVATLAKARGATPGMFVDAAREMAKWRATWGPGISSAQLRQLIDLIERGAKDEEGSDPIITATQQQKLAEALASWLTAWAQQNKAAVSTWSSGAIAAMTGARELVDREEAAALAERDLRDVNALAKSLADLSRPPVVALPERPAGDVHGWGDDVTRQFEMPAAFGEIRLALSPPSPAATSGEKALGDAAKALDDCEAFIARQCRIVGKAAGLDLPEGLPLPAMRQAVAAAVDRFDASHLGPGKALVVRRLEAYGTLLAIVEALNTPEAVQRRFATAPSAEYPHAFFRLPAVLATMRGEVQRARTEAPPTPFGLDAHRGAAFAGAWNKILDRAQMRGESIAWDIALQAPEAAWQTPASRAAGRLDLSVAETPSATLARTFTASSDLSARHLVAWFTAYRAAETALAQSALEDPIAFRARLDAVGMKLEGTAGRFIEAWQATARQAEVPNLTRWSDLKKLGTDGPAEIQARLNAALAGPRQGLAFLAEQDRFAALRAMAAKALAPLNDKALPSTAVATVEFLKSFDAGSAAATREALLRDPAGLQERLAQATARSEVGASVVQDFWGELMNGSVDALVSEARPAAIEHLRDVHKLTDGRFPFCRSGTEAWDRDGLAALRGDLDALRPTGSARLTARMALRIRDLDALDEPWGAYLDWLRHLDAFLAAREPWSVEINKGNGRGAWQAVRIGQAEQTFLDAEHPPTISLEGGAALRSGLTVTLLNRLSSDGGVEAGKLADNALSAPWAVLRLALAGAEPTHIATIEDGRPAGARFVTIKVTSAASAILREMPEKVPALPN